MEKWFVETKRADFNALSAKLNISPVTARLLVNRGIDNEADMALFLTGDVSDMYDPFLLKDMDRAVDIMKKAVADNKKIRIIGDYDIDGICSSFILEKGIRFAGGNCDVKIPHRMYDGYGLNERLIDEAIEDKVECVITCDNGIAASGPIQKAVDAGMTVIVTDHHEVPYEDAGDEKIYKLPPADAVIDPKQADCTYPFKEICGGTVAYKFIKALLSDVSADGIDDLMDELLGFAAFATVGDVMPLVNENHIIVKTGLKLIENTENIGLQALIEQCGLSGKKLTPYEIGFILGPCFNAAGRLDTAERALELLECGSKREAVNMAVDMKELNVVRQDMTDKGIERAVEMVENDPAYKDERVLVVYLPELHESLAGIIAGRLREKYVKPVFVLTDGEDGIKGSGRSIDAYHMFENMTKIADIFVKFGGHKLAAGLSLKKGSYEEFRRRINEVCKLKDEDLIEKVMIDIPMPVRCINKELTEEIKLLEPFGTGNPSPLFAEKNVRFISPTVMGAKRNVVKGVIEGEGNGRIDALRFCDGDEFVKKLNAKGNVLSIAYTIQENTFRGVTKTEIQLRHVDLS